MKKILLIAPEFSPYFERVSVKRVKYFPDFGFFTIVITNKRKKTKLEIDAISSIEKGGFKIYETLGMNKSPFRIFSKLGFERMAKYLEKLFFLPDTYIVWTIIALYKIWKIINTEKIDCIITLSPPESVHIAGLIIHHFKKIPWICDFHDLWTSKKVNHKAVTKLHAIGIKRLEKLVYQKADHIFANTEGNKSIYIKEFSIDPTKISVFTNGYDPAEMESNTSLHDNLGFSEQNVFSIGYMGYFDKKGFPWKEFLFALQYFLEKNERHLVHMDICGELSKNAQRLIKDINLHDIIKYHGYLPHANAINLIKRSSILLLLMYENEYSHAIVPHKLYHYISMGKPILALAEESGNVASIINTTKTGIVTSIAQHPNDIFEILSRLFIQWKNNRKIDYVPNKVEIEKYDIRKTAKNMVNIIESYI